MIPHEDFTDVTLVSEDTDDHDDSDDPDDSDDHDNDHHDSDDHDDHDGHDIKCNLLSGWSWRSVGRYLSSEFTGRQLISSGFVRCVSSIQCKFGYINRMGPSHLGVYLCKAENEIGGDEGGVTLTGEVDHGPLQSDRPTHCTMG